MTEDKPLRPRALTPIEQANLRRLLAQADEFAAFVANSPTAAEERRLKAEQKKLAEQEAKMASNLAELQSSLDRVTGQLETMLRQKMMMNDFGAVAAKRKLKVLVASLRDALPQFAATGKMRPESLAEGLRALIVAYHPEVFEEAPEPTPEDAAAAALDEQRSATARAIIRAGKLRRSEPLDEDDDVVVPFNKDK